MPAALDALVRYARPTLLIVAAFLATGATLTILLMPSLGWLIYAIGHVGLLIALPAVVALYRARMNWVAWLAFVALYLGVVVGLLALAPVLSHHLGEMGLRETAMPNTMTPLGMLSGALIWGGLGAFGVACFSDDTLPKGGSVLFVLAGVLGLIAEFTTFAVFGWGLAVVVTAFGLVWIAPPAEEPERTTVVRSR